MDYQTTDTPLRDVERMVYLIWSTMNYVIAFTPQSQAIPRFGWYAFPVPLRVEGWVFLCDWLAYISRGYSILLVGKLPGSVVPTVVTRLDHKSQVWPPACGFVVIKVTRGFLSLC